MWESPSPTPTLTHTSERICLWVSNINKRTIVRFHKLSPTTKRKTSTTLFIYLFILVIPFCHPLLENWKIWSCFPFEWTTGWVLLRTSAPKELGLAVQLTCIRGPPGRNADWSWWGSAGEDQAQISPMCISEKGHRTRGILARWGSWPTRFWCYLHIYLQEKRKHLLRSVYILLTVHKVTLLL